MLTQLRKRLQGADGRSEFVIAAMCDIRGFSKFSIRHESPDTAMFIKRFYLKLLDTYFKQAVFAKPTGDGLLLIFRYNEHNLIETSELVIETAFKVISDFPKMFADDSMINFTTPHQVGFGVTRGPTCCLFSGRSIIDYSGQLLNLASRLNEFARPCGIVVDGNYLLNVLPSSCRARFSKRNVYVRSIAEESPICVFCSSEVSLPTYALSPLSGQGWKEVTHKMTIDKLSKINGSFRLNLQDEPASMENMQVQFISPSPGLEGFTSIYPIPDYVYQKDSSGPFILFAASKTFETLAK